MQARDVLWQIIADERAVESLCYEDGAEEIHILDRYSAAKLVVIRVFTD